MNIAVAISRVPRSSWPARLLSALVVAGMLTPPTAVSASPRSISTTVAPGPPAASLPIASVVPEAAAPPLTILAPGSSIASVGPFADQTSIGFPVVLPTGNRGTQQTGPATPSFRAQPALPNPPRSPSDLVTGGTAAVSTCGIDPTAAPELIEQARALKNDPDLIYQFVHDSIEYTPIGGTLKGPLGTLVDRRGTAYDQAALMVTLLRQAALSNSAISNVRYELGTIQLNLNQLENFYGVDDQFYSLAFLLGSGGVNATIFVDGTGTHIVSATIDHVWVRVTLNGTDVVFDPSFKTYTRTNSINLPSAMGYSRSAFLGDAQAGSTSTPTSIRGLNRSNVRNDLQTYATNLVNFIHANAGSASISDIIGGKSIVPTTGTLRQANLPYATGTPTDVTSLPSTFHPTLSIALPGASSVTCNADDLYGHRMSVFFDSSHRPVLRIDGATMATGSAGVVGSTMGIGTTINVPFFSGANTSQSLNVTVGGSFLIGNGWDQVGREMVERHRGLLNQARAINSDPTSEAVLGESLALVGYTWLAEVAAQQGLSDELLKTQTEYFYGVGIVGIAQGGGITSPFVDLPLNFINSPTRVNGVATGDPPNSLAAFFDGSGASSGFESGVLEQSQAQIPGFVAASTTRLLDMATQSDTIFDINNPAVPGDDFNFYMSTIRPQLVPNYDAGTLATLDSYVSGGFRVTAPLNGRQAVGRWTGTGFKTISPDGQSIGEIISGGLHGGFGGTDDPDLTFVLSSDGTLVPAYVTYGTGDPIDRVGGAFLYSHDDLTIGSQPFPYGLGFQRSYNSGAQLVTGPLGNGWRHNFDITAHIDSDAFEGMGVRSSLSSSPVFAASAITALFVSSDLLNGFIGPSQQNLNLLVVEAMVNRWFIDRLTSNVVIVSQPGSSEHFARLADSSYAAPPGSATVLSQAGDGSFRYATADGVRLTFNLDGTVASWSNAAGMAINFAYSGGLLSAVSNSVGRQLSLGYTSSRLTSVSDGNGRSVGFGYTSSNLTSFTDALGQLTTFAYDTSGTLDTNGHLTQIFYPAHPANAFVTNSYDRLGRVSRQLDANSNATQAFVAGTRTEFVDPSGARNAWYLDARGNTVRGVADFGLAPHLNVTTAFVYDGQGRQVLTTFPEGNTVAVSYDAGSNPLTITSSPKPGSPLASLTQSFTYVHPVAGAPNLTRLRTSTDALGRTTTYGYDPATGNLTSIDQPAVGGQAPHRSFTYNAAGQPLTETDPTGRITRIAYDVSGNRTAVTQDAGRLDLTSTFSNDAVGNLQAITDARGNTTMLQFDALRRLLRTTAPASVGAVTTYAYDPNGNLLQTSRATGDAANPQVWSTTYTLTGRPLTATNPSNNVTTYAYDALDRLATETDAESRVTSYTYDALSRASQVFNTAIQATPLEQHSYTLNGLDSTVVDARGNSTTYQYDGFDRLVQTRFADSSTEALTYDAVNNLLTRTKRGGQTIAYTYDTLHRLSTKAPQNQPTVSYTYDLSGHLTSVADSSGAFSFGYDTAGRNTSASRPDGKQIAYQLDPAGNRTRLTWPDSYFVSYEFDAANRMAAVRESGTKLLASYTYDPLSRRTGTTYGNGATTTTIYSATDDVNTITNQFNTTSSATFSYTYNRVRQRTGQTVSDGGFAYRPAASSTTSYTTNVIDEYTAVSGTTLTYDGNGNLTRNGTNTYGYDTENRLISALVPGHTVSYTYDPLGRRLTKNVDGAVTNFLSDGQREIAEYDGAGSLLRRNVYGQGIDDLVATVTPVGDHSYAHQDALGSVIARTDDFGSVTERNAYGPYGESTTTGGSGFGFAGRRLDPETGLYYNRARAYSPTLGRFLQPDPIGREGGLNLYAYVNDDPLNMVDPSGQFGQAASDFWDMISGVGQWIANHAGLIIGGLLVVAGVLCLLSVICGGAITLGGGLLFAGEAGLLFGGAGAISISIPVVVGTAVTAAGGTIILMSDSGSGSGGESQPPDLKADGKVHGELPDHVPDNWTNAQLEDAASDLEQSIETRQAEQLRLGEDGPHRARINEEIQLLRQILKKLSGS